MEKKTDIENAKKDGDQVFCCGVSSSMKKSQPRKTNAIMCRLGILLKQLWGGNRFAFCCRCVNGICHLLHNNMIACCVFVGLEVSKHIKNVLALNSFLVSPERSSISVDYSFCRW
jgi:hypothetical protein